MKRLPVLLAWSSGKDSAYTLHILRQREDVEVVGLLTTINEAYDRVAMHAVRLSLLEAQAEAVSLPLFLTRIPSPCPNEVYETVMAAALEDAVARGVRAVAFGDLFLEEVRRYREERMKTSGLELLFPLWGRPTRALAEEMIASGLRARLTCIDPRKLDRSFAGREFSQELLRDLPEDVDPCGENGEFHSFCWDGPMFRQPVRVQGGQIVERDSFLFADLLPENAPVLAAS